MNHVAVRVADRLRFWCPACDGPHEIRVEGANPWEWNDSMTAPTVMPSILVRSVADKPHVCHSYVRGGQIEFLSDCDHALANQRVDLPTVGTWRFGRE